MTLRAYGSLFGARHGEQSPQVLALHGWGRTRSDFDRLLGGSRAIALDLPGFGASPAPDEPLGAAGYARLVEPILHEFDSPPVVLGHSFGGRVAVALAASRPDLVAGLVLVGVPLLRPTGAGKKTSIAYRLVRLGARLGVIAPERLEAARRRYGSADYRAATGVMRDILVKVVNESYEKELAGLRCPVRLVWGDQDLEAPLELARVAVELVGDGRLDIVCDAGHNIHLTHPERVQAAIDELLE